MWVTAFWDRGIHESQDHVALNFGSTLATGHAIEKDRKARILEGIDLLPVIEITDYCALHRPLGPQRDPLAIDKGEFLCRYFLSRVIMIYFIDIIDVVDINRIVDAGLIIGAEPSINHP